MLWQDFGTCLFRVPSCSPIRNMTVDMPISCGSVEQYSCQWGRIHNSGKRYLPILHHWKSSITNAGKQNREQPKGIKMANDHLIVGNIGLYWSCYHLSKLGWNVMPTSRNARGVDIIAYNRNCSTFKTIQVKTLSRKSAVPLGSTIDNIIAEYWIIVNQVQTNPQSYIMLADEVRMAAHRLVRNDSVSFWIEVPSYSLDNYLEAWHRIGNPQK